MGITLETILKGFVNMKLDRAMINCVICNKSMEKFRNKNTCSPECKRKLACQRQARYNLNITKPWEPTEEELREAFPEFYATCKTIVWGKRILKKCLKCGKIAIYQMGVGSAHNAQEAMNSMGEWLVSYHRRHYQFKCS
jgi:hypothetical protein